MNVSEQKLALPALFAMVVGSMVGAGVFSLPATFGRATGGFGALIAWGIAGGGMLTLAFVFQTLALRKPELDAGVYAYAKAGFGDYLGFLSALGFWAGSCVGNVSYFVLIKATLGAFFPMFGEGNTLSAIIISSILLWGFHFLILKGVKEAAAINVIVTIAKLVPLAIFIILAAIFFNYDLFSQNFWGDIAALTPQADLGHLDAYGQVGLHALEIPEQPYGAEGLFGQIRNTMLVTVFVFLGIEGASVYSRYAKNRKDVGKATVLGFLGVLGIFMLVTMLSYGVLSRYDLAGLRQPSVAGVLEAIVGPWGLIFISAGLIVSVLGAYLSWTMLAAEVLYSAAKNRTMPSFLSSENAQKVPSTAMWMTSGLIQVLLVITMFSQQAFTLALELTSSFSLIPYLLVAAFGLKIVLTNDAYSPEDKERGSHLIIAAIATAYTALMIYAGGLKYLLLASIIFAPGTILYVLAQREQKIQAFKGMEKVLLAVIILGAVTAIAAISAGYLTI